MSELTDALENFGCEDINRTMERFLDDEDFYMDMVSQMLDDPAFERLGTELEENNITAAFETAHMLKGVISNCGITPLFKDIVEIVEPLRKNKSDNLLPIYTDFIAKRNKIKDILFGK